MSFGWRRYEAEVKKIVKETRVTARERGIKVPMTVKAYVEQTSGAETPTCSSNSSPLKFNLSDDQMSPIEKKEAVDSDEESSKAVEEAIKKRRDEDGAGDQGPRKRLRRK